MKSFLMRTTLTKAHQISLAIIVGLLVVPTVVSGWQLWSATKKIDYVAQVGVPGAHLIGSIDGLMNKYRKEQWQYLALHPGDPQLAECTDSMTDEKAEMLGLFAAYRQLPLQQRGREELATFQADWRDYVDVTANELTLADSGQYQAAIDTFNTGHGQAKWDSLKKDLAAWRANDVAVASAYRATARQWARWSVAAIVVLLTAALLLTIKVSRLLKTRLTRGLRRLSAAAGGIAAGEVDQQIEVDADDEIAEVARAFADMVTYLRGVVNTMQDQAQQLATMAHHDALTGLPNRRAWDLAIADGLKAAHRSGAQLCVAVIDIDHFKSYNDTHGHPAGDALLRTAAKAWRAVLHPSHLLARYGGEEFTIMTSNATVDQVVAIVARLRTATPSGQTFSAGIAVWDGSETGEQLVRRADDALYRAKHAGRDQAQVAELATR
ncbi:Inner membrane protein yfiN [Actinoplanes sp. SE50]|uniref:diguanylate cyclase domain-containing protein n=1 Tax=unclassified Actinoplanes TaxID=2626549 RepID=UPI00023ECE88|nr:MULTISPECIES: diguanylate cyclase [unclassified Actinoplanes]AEV84336.1 Inner membrane protein yfiN [Actinoplanes sp. SE50/110]ATO82728.1 Inner membrane protein yfiN [Actinoplanes sp. SE50]SLM00135.1 Inner membrane protein yfiN [Actinoplanes sp. SE50/110]